MYNYMKVILSAVKTYIDKIAANINAKIPVKTSQLENDENYATEEYVDNNSGKVKTINGIEPDETGNVNIASAIKPFPIYEKTKVNEETTRLKVNIEELEHGVLYSFASNDVDTPQILGYLYIICDDGTEKRITTIDKTIVFKITKRISSSEKTILLYDEFGYLYTTIDFTNKSTANDVIVNKNIYNYLSVVNTTEYTPTGDYHPATKKYVDDSSSSISNEISNTYETKEDASAKLEEAKGYADQVKSDILGGAPKETLDTIAELATAFEENAEVVEAINQAITNKADKEHVHSWEELENKPFGKGENITLLETTTFDAGNGDDWEFLLEISEEVAQAIENNNGANVVVNFDGSEYNGQINYIPPAWSYMIETDYVSINLQSGTTTLYISIPTAPLNGTHSLGISLRGAIKKIDQEYLDGVVFYNEQELTEEQKNQVRKNLGLYNSSQTPKILFEGCSENDEQGDLVEFFNGDEVLVSIYGDSDGAFIESHACTAFGSSYDMAGLSICLVGNHKMACDSGDDAAEFLVDKTVGTDLPFVVACSGTDYGVHTYALVDESMLSSRDRIGVYRIVVESTTDTETAYETIPEEYIPENIVRKEDIPEVLSEVLLYTEQPLTEEQQMQARKNLGLYSSSSSLITSGEITVTSGIGNLYISGLSKDEQYTVIVGGYDFTSTSVISGYANGVSYCDAIFENESGWTIKYKGFNAEWEFNWGGQNPDGTHAVEVWHDEIIKIPEEFIPETIARVSDIPEVPEHTWEALEDKPFDYKVYEVIGCDTTEIISDVYTEYDQNIDYEIYHTNVGMSNDFIKNNNPYEYVVSLGDSINVVFDGESYNVNLHNVYWDSEFTEYLACGNGKLGVLDRLNPGINGSYVGYFGEDEPFLIILLNDKFKVFTKDTEKHTIKISYVGTTLKLLDDMFISDNIARVDDIPDGFSGSWNDLKDKPFGSHYEQDVIAYRHMIEEGGTNGNHHFTPWFEDGEGYANRRYPDSIRMRVRDGIGYENIVFDEVLERQGRTSEKSDGFWTDFYYWYGNLDLIKKYGNTSDIWLINNYNLEETKYNDVPFVYYCFGLDTQGSPDSYGVIFGDEISPSDDMFGFYFDIYDATSEGTLVHTPLDEQYIPDTIARIEDIPEGFSGSWNDLTDRPFGEVSEYILDWSGNVYGSNTISAVAEDVLVDSSLIKVGETYTLGFNGSTTEAKVEQIYMNQVIGFRNVTFDNGYKIEYQIQPSQPNYGRLVVYNSNEWQESSDVPEALDVTFTIAKSTVKQIPIEYIPDELMDEAKSYADSAASTVKNDLLNGAGDAYDTLKELGELIDSNKDALQALEEVAIGKADAEHTHSWNDLEDRPFYTYDLTFDANINPLNNYEKVDDTTFRVLSSNSAIRYIKSCTGIDINVPTVGYVSGKKLEIIITNEVGEEKIVLNDNPKYIVGVTGEGYPYLRFCQNDEMPIHEYRVEENDLVYHYVYNYFATGAYSEDGITTTEWGYNPSTGVWLGTNYGFYFTVENNVKLDEKFIPNTIARVDDIPEVFSGSWNDLIDRPFGEYKVIATIDTFIPSENEFVNNSSNKYVFDSSSFFYETQVDIADILNQLKQEGIDIDNPVGMVNPSEHTLSVIINSGLEDELCITVENAAYLISGSISSGKQFIQFCDSNGMPIFEYRKYYTDGVLSKTTSGFYIHFAAGAWNDKGVIRNVNGYDGIKTIDGVQVVQWNGKSYDFKFEIAKIKQINDEFISDNVVRISDLDNAIIQSDWDQIDETSKDYIKNRPFGSVMKSIDVSDVDLNSNNCSLFTGSTPYYYHNKYGIKTTTMQDYLLGYGIDPFVPTDDFVNGIKIEILMRKNSGEEKKVVLDNAKYKVSHDSNVDNYTHYVIFYDKDNYPIFGYDLGLDKYSPNYEYELVFITAFTGRLSQYGITPTEWGYNSSSSKKWMADSYSFKYYYNGEALLDEKYIPDTIARVSDIDERFEELTEADVDAIFAEIFGN